MKFTPEHRALEDTVIKFCDKELNPFVPEWEAKGQFPAHEVFKKLGDLGLLGLKYPEEYGGAGLDFSYSMVMAEALGQSNCGGVPMAIGVHTDMATPALARFGSDELRKEFLVPTIAGDVVACLGVSEPGGGSDVFLRELVKHLTPVMGTSFGIDNVRGGSGAAAGAPGDGGGCNIVATAAHTAASTATAVVALRRFV
jgi:hypothetical protein